MAKKEKIRVDRLPKPLVAAGPIPKKVPEHLLLARLYRFEWEGETFVFTADRHAVQEIRRLQAACWCDGKDIPTVDVEVLSIQKLTKLNVVAIFKAGLESIVLDRDIRSLPPFGHRGAYARYSADFVRKPRKPKKTKSEKARIV
jgi:hypothetical protein